MLKEKLTKWANKDMTRRVDNKVLEEIEKGGEEEEEDKRKVSRLVKQYTEFKTKNLPNFLFNPEKGTEQYSKSF